MGRILVVFKSQSRQFTFGDHPVAIHFKKRFECQVQEKRAIIVRYFDNRVQNF